MAKFSKSRHARSGGDDYNFPYEETTTNNEFFKIASAGNKPTVSAPHALTAAEVTEGLNNTPEKTTDNIHMSGASKSESPLEALKRKVAAKPTQEEPKNPVTSLPRNPKKEPDIKNDNWDNQSLLEKCMPFITEGGHSVPEDKPSYTLESVESILNTTQSTVAKLLEQLNNVGSVKFDDLSKSSTVTDTVDEEPKVQSQPEKEPEIIEMQSDKPEPIAIISDIDATHQFTKTISFDIKDSENDFEDISSGTRIIDPLNEFFEDEPEETAYIENRTLPTEDTFTVDTDYTSFADAKNIGTTLKIKRRSAFLKSFFTVILTGLFAMSQIPLFAKYFASNQTIYYCFTAILFALISTLNADMFSDIVTLFTPRKRCPSLLGISTIAASVYILFSIFSGFDPYFVVLAASVSICFKTFASFMRSSYLLGNFTVIANSAPKYAVKFIDDRQTTFAMARNFIEGDVLVASEVECKNVLDYLKNSYSDDDFCGRLNTLTVVSLVAASVLALFFGISVMSAQAAIQTFSFVLAVTAAPTLFFTDILAVRRTSKKLNPIGAMLTGTDGAKKVGLANAVSMKSIDLFPDGTVTLYNMKILDSNRIDSTLIDAAAITTQIGSPLSYIFSSIAKTGNSPLPEADSIKYEERMGISGWINDRRIFIGNSTLLQAHGISTPPMEVDKKILRQGYFPVYLACDGKPCAMLMVKYHVKTSIASELQKLCGIGVTLLVDSCDPNLTDEMICDYFGLYSESVRVISGSGSHMLAQQTEPVESFPSPAVHRGQAEAILGILNCADRIKRSSKALSIYHITSVSAALCYFLYSAYSSSAAPGFSLGTLIYFLISLTVSSIVYLFNRP